MNTLCKTSKGTIGAFWWHNGIALGIKGKDNFISLEYDHDTDKLRILLNESEMRKQGFEIVKANEKWKEM